MENDKNTKEAKKQKMGLKTKIILFQLLVIVSLVVLGIYFRGRVATANQYLNEHNTLSMEKTRCEELMARQSGDFDEYQYCRQLLQAFSE